jgi:hypothetical protein
VLDPSRGFVRVGWFRGPNIAYLPSAFNEQGLTVLRERFPDAILVNEEDAAVLGLNSFGDGYNMVIVSRLLTSSASFASGYKPIGVDLPSCFSVAAASSAAPSNYADDQVCGGFHVPEDIAHNTYHPLPVVVATAEGHPGSRMSTGVGTSIASRRTRRSASATGVRRSSPPPQRSSTASALTSRAFHNDPKQ